MPASALDSRDHIFHKISILSVIIISLVLYLIFSSGFLLSEIGPADSRLFLALNSHHNSFFDPIMYLASDKLFWIPGYAVLIILMIKEFGRDCWKPLLIIGLLILFADQLSSHLIKNIVQRLRPSHNPALMPYIHLSKAGPGGLYGFVSSHAANAFALAAFISALMSVRIRYLWIIMYTWAILVSYSRIYNGVHYPADVLFAGLIGMLSGYLFYQIFQLLFQKSSAKI